MRAIRSLGRRLEGFLLEEVAVGTPGAGGPEGDHGAHVRGPVDGARRRLPAPVAVSAVPGIDPAPSAYALASAIAVRYGVPLVVEIEGPDRGPTLLASAEALGAERDLAGRLDGLRARGRVCSVSVPADKVAEAVAAAREVAVPVLCVPAGHLEGMVADREVSPGGALLSARLPRDRPLVALAARELVAAGLRVRVMTERPRGLLARRALAGSAPPGDPGFGRAAERLVSPAGQALPLTLGLLLCVVALTTAFAALGGAVTAAGREQRSVDLAAVSAARRMREDLPRALAPARLADGRPNPTFLPRAEFVRRSVRSAERAARRNGLSRIRVSFPADRVPMRATVVARTGGRRSATAEVGAGATALEASGGSAVASGGGYSGPLELRDGEGMRPDVARAYDRMAAAAARAGHRLSVTSGFRSDAEQAILFARNPDPRMVAPPGRSLHRCATELDLGPSSAWRWLASNARRHGFVQRYSWEPWHYGFTSGEPPCSKAGQRGGTGDGRTSRRDPAAGGIPSFVPARFRPMISRAASRHGVSARLLAAQLQAESGFDPRAVSPAGAQGIAQFMPATARQYGLRNPFDPAAAIDAQARMMAELLRAFDGSVALALAAYNAGPGAVRRYGGIPPFAETRAYVARILAVLGGAGAALPPPQDLLEVRLVA